MKKREGIKNDICRSGLKCLPEYSEYRENAHRVTCLKRAKSLETENDVRCRRWHDNAKQYTESYRYYVLADERPVIGDNASADNM